MARELFVYGLLARVANYMQAAVRTREIWLDEFRLCYIFTTLLHGMC